MSGPQGRSGRVRKIAPPQGFDPRTLQSLLHIGLKTSKWKHGTGFLITGCAIQCILGFEPVKEKMFKLRIKGNFYNVINLSVHAPTEDEIKRNAEDVGGMIL
jgi:hypothetical protein